MAKYSGRSLTVDFEGSPMGQLHAFSEFGSVRNQIDASVYGETWTDTVAGLKDGTTVTGQVLYDSTDAGAAAFIASYDTVEDPVTFSVTHEASGDTFDITCKLTKLAWESALDGLYAMNFEAKIVNPGVQGGS